MTREKTIERRYTETVADKGGICYKFVSPGNSGVPDRLCLSPIHNAEHRRIVSQYVWFAECKKPGGKLDVLQQRQKIRIEKLGFEVHLIDK